MCFYTALSQKDSDIKPSVDLYKRCTLYVLCKDFRLVYIFINPAEIFYFKNLTDVEKKPNVHSEKF